MKVHLMDLTLMLSRSGGPQAYKSSARSTALSVLEASPATGSLRE